MEAPMYDYPCDPASTNDVPDHVESTLAEIVADMLRDVGFAEPTVMDRRDGTARVYFDGAAIYERVVLAVDVLRRSFQIGVDNEARALAVAWPDDMGDMAIAAE